MAAGFSRRFGPEDKRLMRLPDGSTLLQQTLSRIRPAFTDPDGRCNLAVVIRPDDDPEQLGIPHDCTLLRAPNAVMGLGASIADGMRSALLFPEWEALESVAIMLGDMPSLQHQTLSALLAETASDRIVRPLYRGQPGHPVLFGRQFWTELCALSGDDGAKSIIAAHRNKLVMIALEDEGTVRDVDTPR